VLLALLHDIKAHDFPRPKISGVTIGRARRAVHAGPALWGAENLPDTVF